MEKISFTYKERQLEGIVVNERKGELTIKLNSGYNIIVPKAEIEIIKKIPQEKDLCGQARKITEKPNLPTIALLHTGGTVASKVDYSTGAVIAAFSPEQIVELFPELTEIANVRSKLVANIQSEMMRFAHWNILANAVKEARVDGADGVIITHGTDVLHMTGAALTFALEGLDIPVVLVGSQRSSDRPSSDAASNLLCAATFIAKHGKEFPAVALCLHEGIEKDDCVILPGARCRKMHTSRRDAFKPINDSPFARIHYPKLTVEKLCEFPQATKGKFAVRPFREDLKVGMLRMRPQMWLEEFQTYEGFDGLVLELLGIGHAPTMVTDEHNPQHESILAEIQLLAKQMPVAAAPQTIFGRLNMNVYTPGRQLIEAGVLGQGLDMTPETAFVKLAWLLSNKKKEDIADAYHATLRGELSERSDEDGYTI